MCKNICLILVSFSIFFLFNPNNSNAFEIIGINSNDIVGSLPKGRNYNNECKTHLKKTNYNQDRISMDKRNLKKAALIGAVFGIKFAVGPKEIRKNKSRSSIAIWGIESAGKGTSEAMAIAAFRKCENEKSLKQLIEAKLLK